MSLKFTDSVFIFGAKSIGEITRVKPRCTITALKMTYYKEPKYKQTVEIELEKYGGDCLLKYFNQSFILSR